VVTEPLIHTCPCLGHPQEDSASGVDLSTIPIVPELEDSSWFSQDTWRDLPYDYSTLMENVSLLSPAFAGSVHVTTLAHSYQSWWDMMSSSHLHMPPWLQTHSSYLSVDWGSLLLCMMFAGD
jgi:hypothetical protein